MRAPAPNIVTTSRVTSARSYSATSIDSTGFAEHEIVVHDRGEPLHFVRRARQTLLRHGIGRAALLEIQEHADRGERRLQLVTDLGADRLERARALVRLVQEIAAELADLVLDQIVGDVRAMHHHADLHERSHQRDAGEHRIERRRERRSGDRGRQHHQHGDESRAAPHEASASLTS